MCFPKDSEKSEKETAETVTVKYRKSSARLRVTIRSPLHP